MQEDVTINVSPFITVTDVDAGTGNLRMTVSVLNETLSVSGFTAVPNNAATVVLTGTLTQLNAAATIINYRTNLNYNGSDTLSVTVSDLGNTGIGGALIDGPESAVFTVAPVNDAPVLDLNGAGEGNGFTATFEEGEGPVAIVDAAAMTVIDVDSATLVSATVALNVVDAADVLTATATGAINVTYNAGTRVLTLAGADTVANYQQVLRSVTFNNTSLNPVATQRTATFRVEDSLNAAGTAASVITIEAVDDAPQIDLDSTAGGTGYTASFVEGAGPTAIVNPTGLTVIDPDSPLLLGATVVLASPTGTEVLAATAGGGITVPAYNADGTR